MSIVPNILFMMKVERKATLKANRDKERRRILARVKAMLKEKAKQDAERKAEAKRKAAEAKREAEYKARIALVEQKVRDGKPLSREEEQLYFKIVERRRQRKLRDRETRQSNEDWQRKVELHNYELELGLFIN